MKLFKATKLFVLLIIILFLSSCRNISDEIIATYEFHNTVKVAVLTEERDINFIDLILDDPNNLLNRSDITYDLSSVNLEVIGIYTVDVRYMTENGDSKTISITVDVVDEVKPVVSGIKDYTININSSIPSFLDGLTVEDNYDGTIALTESNIDSSQVKLDTEGRYNVKLTVTDSSGNEGIFYFTVNIIDPNTFYVISYSEDMKVTQYRTSFNYDNFIMSVKDNKHQDLLEDGYTIELNASEINTSLIGDYPLIVYLKDPSGNIVKVENKTVKVVSQVTIQFKSNKTVDYNNLRFKPEDLIEQVVDDAGDVVTLGSNYILTLDKNVDVTMLGPSNYTYTIKDLNNNILFFETITITVKYTYEIVFTEDQFKCVTNSPCNLHQFITGYKDMSGQDINITALGLTLYIEGSVNTAITGIYNVTYQLLDENQVVLFSRNIEINVSYNIHLKTTVDISENISLPSELIISVYDDSTHESLIIGQDCFISVLEPFDLSSPGYYTYTFVLKDMSGNSLVKFVEDITVLDASYDIPDRVTIDVVNQAKIIITQEMTRENFDFKSYVLGLYDEYGKLLDSSLYTLVCFDCETIEFGKAGNYDISLGVYYNPYPFNILGYIDIEIFIPEGYDLVLSKDLSFTIGEFTPDLLFSQILDSDGQVFTLTNDHAIDIFGSYDCEIPDTYNVIIGVFNMNTATYLDLKNVQFEILPLADIIFEPIDVIHLDDMVFDMDDLVLDVVDLNGHPLTGYEIMYLGDVDVNYSGKYEVVCYAYNALGKLITTEKRIITVGQYVIEPDPWTGKIYLGTHFDINSLNYEIYDHAGNLIDMSQTNYRLSFSNETPYDTNIVDQYNLDVVLHDENNNIVARTPLEVEVYSNYDVDINTDVDVSDGFTTPSELLKSIWDDNTGQYLTLGEECQISVLESFDLSYPGSHTYTIELKDMSGNLLTRFTRDIFVTDINYVVPDEINIIVPEDRIIITTDVNESEFDINQYVAGLYNKDNGEPLNPRYYTVTYDVDIEFGNSGEYFVDVLVYYNGDHDRLVDYKTITVYITEGYTIIPQEDIWFYMDDFIMLDRFVGPLLDAKGNEVAIEEFEITFEGFEEIVPGIYEYEVSIEIRRIDTGSLVAVDFQKFKVKPLVDIIFIDQYRYDVFDPDFIDVEHMVVSVNDLNNHPLPKNSYEIEIHGEVSIDRSYNYYIDYYVYDLTGKLLAIEQLLIIVGEYTLNPDIQDYSVNFGGTVIMSDYEIFDTNHNKVDLTEVQLNPVEFELPIDTTYNGNHENAIIIRDDYGKIIARTPISIYVESSLYDLDIPEHIFTYVNEDFDPKTYIDAINEIEAINGVIEGNYDLNSLGTYPLEFCIYDEFDKLVYRQSFTLHVEMMGLDEIVTDNVIVLSVNQDMSNFNISNYVDYIVAYGSDNMSKNLFTFDFPISSIDLTIENSGYYPITATLIEDPSYTITQYIEVIVTTGWVLVISEDLSFEVNTEVELDALVIGAYTPQGVYLMKDESWDIAFYTDLDYTTMGKYGATIVLYDIDDPDKILAQTNIEINII